jgi:hypothetical protein
MTAITRSRLVFLLVFAIFTLSLPACRVKEGCPTKDYTNKMEKRTKRGKSELFPKTMRKRMNR